MSEPNIMQPTAHLRVRQWEETAVVSSVKMVQERWEIQQMWTDGLNQEWRTLPVFLDKPVNGSE